MKYLAVLGREPAISLAELSALFDDVKIISDNLALFIIRTGDRPGGGPPRRLRGRREGLAGPVPNINKLGGSLKLAVQLDSSPLEYLRSLPDGKLTIGVSDYSKNASKKSATTEALKLKKILVRHGRSVRVVENKDAILSTATSLHNGLSGKNDRKCELIKYNTEWFRVVGVQDIDAYARRDQARPARDAKVGMLPPKLAQILINLCGPLPEGSTILDPFCGTGVVLQEALLMGYRTYGTDISEKMVAYSERNLKWLFSEHGEERRASLSEPHNDGRERKREEKSPFQVSVGDATIFHWSRPIDAVACEGYLGQPMSQIPSEIKLKEQQQECGSIVLGFLKNLSTQIKSGTPVVIAVPAWLRQDGTYSRLKILDEIENMGYNVSKTSRDGLIYHRENQIVARDIIILRKK
ncbi:hypothetical protein IKF57_01750 [Candidatus Saccharibacteria bacterium]|nr:hypothetical protein [Candidatus Saccharibacteria bacterium]